MAVVTTYTGADTAAGFKAAVVAEVKRRVGVLKSEEHRDRGVQAKTQRMMRMRELETLAEFVEAIEIKPE